MEQNDQQALLNTLAGKEPKLREGINAILSDKLRFDSLDRAITNLKNAQNDTNLGSVEAALQTAMTRIRELNETNKSDIPDEKATLYLYTLQNLTQCLGTWQFNNGNENHYTPQIIKKYNTLMTQSAAMGLDTAVINDKCFAHQYQVANDPYLAKFELLDHNKMDVMLNGIERIQNGQLLAMDKQAIKDDLNAPEKETNNGEIDHGAVELRAIKEQNLDQLIADMTARWGDEHMALTYINKNVNTFFHMIGISTNYHDQESQKAFATAIVKRLAEHQKMQGAETAPTTKTVGTVK